MTYQEFEFVKRAIATLTGDEHERYFPFPQVASKDHRRRLCPDGFPVYYEGMPYIISGINLSNIINGQFTIRFDGEQVIHFRYDDDLNLSYLTDYDSTVAYRVFGQKMIPDTVLRLAITALIDVLSEKREKLSELIAEGLRS